MSYSCSGWFDVTSACGVTTGLFFCRPPRIRRGAQHTGGPLKSWQSRIRRGRSVLPESESRPLKDVTRGRKWGFPQETRGDLQKGSRRCRSAEACSLLVLFWDFSAKDRYKFAFSSLRSQCIIRASTPSTFLITEKEPHSYGYGRRTNKSN